MNKPTKRERAIVRGIFPEFKGIEIEGAKGKMNEFVQWAMVDHFAEALANYRMELAKVAEKQVDEFSYNIHPRLGTGGTLISKAMAKTFAIAIENYGSDDAN